MINEHLDSRFLFPNPLLPLGDFLMKFSEQSLFPVSVRSLEGNNSVNDMKVIMHNKASGSVRGFVNNTVVGMTIPQILDTMNIDPTQKALELEAIDKNDKEALQNNCQSTHHQITLDGKGFLRVFQRIVTPLAGYNGKTIALNTTSLELTQYTNLLYLFEYYKRYYTNHEGKTSSAIICFSQYLGLNSYFSETLSMNEMTVLLAMVSDSRHKQAANLVSAFLKKPYSAKSISTCAALIREKLKPELDIYTVLSGLREHYQLQHRLFSI